MFETILKTSDEDYILKSGGLKKSVFSVAVPVGESLEIPFNLNKEWTTDPRFTFNPTTGVLSVPGFTGSPTGEDALGGWDLTPYTIEKIYDNKGIKLSSIEPSIKVVQSTIDRVSIGHMSGDSVFRIRNINGDIIFDSGDISPYIHDYIDSRHIELELMKINFQSISWAQFAIYDDFSNDSKRANPDPSPNLSVVYKSYLYNGDDTTPNKIFGFQSKTYQNITTYDIGTSTSVGLNFLEDTNKNWFEDECKKLFLIDSNNNSFEVQNNTNNRLTISGTPSSGNYRLRDKDPSYAVVFCTLSDQIWDGYGDIKIEVSFNNGNDWQIFYETNLTDLRQSTVAINETGFDYIVRFTLTNDNEGRSPFIYKFLICTDPSPWRF